MDWPFSISEVELTEGKAQRYSVSVGYYLVGDRPDRGTGSSMCIDIYIPFREE